VANRLGRLGPDALELTAVAAVMGRDIEFEVLRRASALGEREAAAAVGRGAVREVVHPGPVTPLRRLLHGVVARALEEVHADRLEPHDGALGRHYREGEIWDRAVAHLRLAGRQAAARGAYRESVTLLRQALDALVHLPESRRDAGGCHRSPVRSPERAAAPERVPRGHRVPAPGGGAGGQARRPAPARLGHLEPEHGDLPPRRLARRLDAARRALYIATAVGDTDLLVSTRFRLGMASYSPGDYRGAVRHLEDCVNRLGADV